MEGYVVEGGREGGEGGREGEREERSRKVRRREGEGSDHHAALFRLHI